MLLCCCLYQYAECQSVSLTGKVSTSECVRVPVCVNLTLIINSDIEQEKADPRL